MARRKPSPPKAPPREIELKLEIARGAVSRLLEHPLLIQAKRLTDQGGDLHAVYYDTEDQALRRAGLSLRIRRQNGRQVQTIKATGKLRGLALDRGEWETVVDGALDFDAALGTPLAPLIEDEERRERIRPAFTVETDRKAFELQRDGAVVELALDEATISAGDRRIAFAEIELELKEGSPSTLFGIARGLAEAAPLRLAPIAKSERGYELADGAAAEPVHAPKIKLPSDATSAEAFQIIARACLSQVVRNEAILRRTRQEEALHQMRVGLRRLRAAMSLFKDMLASPEAEAVRNELRWVGRQLGPARDLDVLLGRLRGSPEGMDGDRLSQIERRRSEAYEALFEALESHRLMRAIVQTAAWIEAGEWMTSEGPAASGRQKPAKEHAREELSRRFKRVRKLGKHLAGLSDEERHEVRIRVKKLRYGADFFGSLFPDRRKKRKKSLGTILSRIQDLLGEMNDLAVGGTLIALPENAPEQTERHRKKLLAKAEAAMGKLSKTEPFWV